MNYRVSHLQQLEAESIHIMREVVSEFEKPVMLYSVGKDSSVLLHLARKAFYPAAPPFPLLHIDTSYKFPEMYTFRDQMAADVGMELIVKSNREALAAGTNPFKLGTGPCCAQLKTAALLNALNQGGYDAAFGGARRDEEKARAKERIFSFRDQWGQWDPKNQRPELWQLYNTRLHKGESIRVFPISNWTEMDIWHYILQEEIPIVPLYFAQRREVVDQDGVFIPLDQHPFPNAVKGKRQMLMSRFRSLGCIPCTGAVPSKAQTVGDIIGEMLAVRTSERAQRVIDHDSQNSMEDKKREGYF